MEIFCKDCEADTGLSCNILPLYKVKALSGKFTQLGPPTVHPRNYNHSPVKNLGSYIVFLYHGNEKCRVLCEVADIKCYRILGGKHSLRMKYVDFPKIHKPTVNTKLEKTIKAVREEPIKASTSPMSSVIMQSKGHSITINGKTYRLPTTKEHLLREYADVFQGIGTIPGGKYHMKLMKDYKPVQIHDNKYQLVLSQPSEQSLKHYKP